MNCLRFIIVELFVFILTVLQRRQEPPDHLQIEEITVIVQRIARKRKEVAYLTKLFATYEIEDIICSRISEDETAEALIMLSCYMESNCNRNLLAEALNKVNLHSLPQKVLSGYFVYGDDD